MTQFFNLQNLNMKTYDLLKFIKKKKHLQNKYILGSHRTQIGPSIFMIIGKRSGHYDFDQGACDQY